MDKFFDTLRTVALLAAIALVAGLTGYAIVGSIGLLVALGAVIVLMTAGLGAPPELVLRLAGGRRLSHVSAPRLMHMVARLAARARIPVPAVFLLPGAAANAMATGSAERGGALGVTAGALQLLSVEELEGVLAHELAHLRHGDTATMQLAGIAARTVTSLLRMATWLAFFALLFTGAGYERLLLLSLLGVLVPVVIGALTAALSRTRELAADRTAAELTGKPWALASALTRLEHHHTSWLDRMLGRSEAPEWLRSHPPTRERVSRLLELARLPV